MAIAVIVALGQDDAAVLVTLTAPRMAPLVVVDATAREEENAGLLDQTAGQFLGGRRDRVVADLRGPAKTNSAASGA